MPIRINLKELIGSDSQGVTVDKLNFNFNKLLELGIGTAGPTGTTGSTGSAGPAGGVGPAGARGSLWFTGSGLPATGAPTTGILANDLYVDGDTGDQYKWDGTAWNIVTDFGSIITTVLSTVTSVAFVRDLQLSGTNTRFITFNTRNSISNDTLTGSSNNDILFLNNFNEGGISQSPNDLYTALARIDVNYTSGVFGRYHLQMGTYFQDTNSALGGGNQLTETKHDLKFRHVVDVLSSPGVNKNIYTGRFSMSKNEIALMSDIDFNSMFEFVSAKWDGTTPHELRVRIGSKEALGEYYNGVVSNGISFNLDSKDAEIGIQEDYKIFTNSTSRQYLTLSADNTIDSVLVKKKLVQDGGNIEQTGTGEFVEKDTATTGQTSPTSGTPQTYGNSGIVKIGNQIITIDGASADSNGTYSLNNPSLIGTLNVYDVTSNSNVNLIHSAIRSGLSGGFNGIALSDIKIVGNYAYIVHNSLATDYSSSAGYTLRDITVLDLSSITESSTGVITFDVIDKIETGGSTASNKNLHRIEIVGNKAIASTQGLRSFGPSATNAAQNNMFGTSYPIIRTYDISNPRGGIVAHKQSGNTSLVGAGKVFQSLDLAVKGRYAYAMGLAFKEEGSSNTDLSYEQKIVRVYIEDVSDTDYYAVSSPMYTSSTNINASNHNAAAGNLNKFGSISISGKYLYSMYRNKLDIFDIEVNDLGSNQTVDTSIPLEFTYTFDTDSELRSMDSKIVGDSLYILYSKGTTAAPYDIGGESGIIKIDLRNINSSTNKVVTVWKKTLSETNASRMTVDGNHIYVVCSGKNNFNKVISVEIDGIVADHIDTGYVSANKVQTEEVQTSAINAVAVNSDEIHTRELSAEKVRVQYGTDPSYLMSMNYIGVPVGGIIMWSGSESDIGVGDLWNFIECNGTGNIPSTVADPEGRLISTLYGGSPVPNLKGRFAIGNDELGNEYGVGETGGSDSTPITVANLPNHRHLVNLRTGSATSENLQEASENNNRTDDGAHTHEVITGNGTAGGKFDRGGNQGINENQWYGEDSGAHAHEVRGWTDEAGGSSSAQNIEILPPYYVVTYIMRVA